ncbi:MAG: 23S rRNA (uridine(2552)-2'-O)-methyltransferase RlmE [Gammaproteobacteria bacterium]|nr:23S rRNA (uridine(2552)-2'-O)-methyltransferase RlmE [Gammaproteobacteria bacterium]
MARSKSSERWLREHFSDAFVRRAQALGLRSRAAFKLLEIDDRDRLLKPGQVVVDLGAAPGGWAQVAADRVAPGGAVIALDLLPIDPLPGVTVLQGDFTEQAVLDRLLEILGERRVDLVLSDMAPNMSGMKAVDQPRASLLAELALECAREVLRPGGDLLLKMFHGEGFEPLLKELRAGFAKVVVRKPKASRPRSREVYLLARNYRLV